MKKLQIAIIFILLLSLCSITVCGEAEMPYTNYTYTESGSKLIYSPQAYVAEKIVYGDDLGIGKLVEAGDIHCDDNGYIYILDSGNNRVVILNSDYTLNRIHDVTGIDPANGEITLKGAQGIFVDEDYIYICDTEHARILITDIATGALVKTIGTPKASVLDEEFIFKPSRIVADTEKELYVVSEGTYEGILNMDFNGNFMGFFASNKVSTSSWDLFWRRFSTREQRTTMIQLVPQQFSSIDLDASGFFMVTTLAAYNDSMVKRINPGGKDIIRQLSAVPITGDPTSYGKGKLTGLSTFGDVSSGNYRIYACLDTNRGKVFCYNNDGYLLYNFGIKSEQFGGFSQATALTYTTNDEIAVLDSATGAFTVFAPTEYGKAINKGVDLLNRLEYDKAVEQWDVVLSYNSNFQLAQNMIGKALYSDGEYGKAMEYFQETGNKSMYSQAKAAQRNEWIHANINWIVALILVLIAGFTAWGLYGKHRDKKLGVERVVDDD